MSSVYVQNYVFSLDCSSPLRTVRFRSSSVIQPFISLARAVRSNTAAAATTTTTTTIHRYRETMWPSNRMCAYQMDLMRASRKTWRRDDELDALRKRLVDIVGPALGFEDGKRVRLGATMEVAHCYHRHGKDVPVDESVVDRLQHLFWQLKVNAFTKTDLPLLRITIGRLLNELFQKMNQAIESPENSPKWCQFSGHDSTMIPLMTSLGLYSAGWPQYGSNVVLELWERTTDRPVLCSGLSRWNAAVPNVLVGVLPTHGTSRHV